MNFEEKLAEAQGKTKKLKEVLNASAERAIYAHCLNKEEIAEELAELDAELKVLDAAIDARIADDIAVAEGDINAAAENACLTKDHLQSKLNAALLKAQMNVNAAKAKIAENKAACDESERQQRIIDLFNYADHCYYAALATVLNAEAAILEAAAEAVDFTNKQEINHEQRKAEQIS